MNMKHVSLRSFFLGGILTAIAFGLATQAFSQGPVQVFILAGQSNMEGKAVATTLDPILADPNKASDFTHLKNGDAWAVRDDVHVTFRMNRVTPEAGTPLYGPLTIGFGSEKTVRNDENQKVPALAFGPELGFGWVMGEHFEQPVLLIKTAWGGRSIKRSFRPPSAMPGEEELEAELASIREKKNPEMTMEELQESFGSDYRAMLAEVADVLGDIETYVPGYDDAQGYEIAGFVWFQGWNDGVGSGNPDYADQLAHFIRDVRDDLETPDMPFVIGEMGVDGLEPMGWIATFRAQQEAAAAVPEFADNVQLAKTAHLWPTDLPDLSEEWEEFRAKDAAQRAEAEAAGERPDPDFFHREWNLRYKEQHAYTSDKRYHYLGSGECYYRMGDAFGQAMLDMIK
jgi:hypothetical protein